MTQTSKVQLPLSADSSAADAIHPSGSRRAIPAPTPEFVCKPKDGCTRHPSSFTLFALACRRALAGCRRATHPDSEGAASALRRHLCSRRRPPSGSRRAPAAADAEAICKREEGRLPTPLLNSVALFALTRQPVAVAQLT